MVGNIFIFFIFPVGPILTLVRAGYFGGRKGRRGRINPYAFSLVIMDGKNAEKESTGHFQSSGEIPMTVSIILSPWRPLKHDHLRGSFRKRQFSKQ